ncbi:MAG: pentapeptide repeat-containing protein [Pseudomonadota bacterium]
MLSGLIGPAISLILSQAGGGLAVTEIPARDLEWAVDACSIDGAPRDAALIDARNVIGATAFRKELESVGAQSVIVYGGDFTGEDMRDVAPLLSDACIVGTVLKETDWRETRLSNVWFHGVTLWDIDANGASWTSTYMRGSNFRGADFSGADLTGLRFVSAQMGSDFGGVTFAQANLTGASFACGITSDSWCINGGPDFSDADLTRADISGLGLWSSDNGVGAKIDHTMIAPRSLGAMEKAQIAGPVILTSYFASPYESERQPPTAQVSAEEARALIDATIAATPDAPSFDCADASSKVEVMICGEYDVGLRQVDRELAKAWSRARTEGVASLREQREWLASRAECDDRTCLQEKYEQRIGELLGAIGPGLILAPDQSVTYHDDTLPLPDAIRATDLYKRIYPVLINASWQRVTLTGNEDGSIRGEGDAVGGNAHICGMRIDSMAFDPETGWWSADDPNSEKLVPILRIDGRKLAMRYSGNLGSTPAEARDLLTCGARAGFGDGIDLTPG